MTGEADVFHDIWTAKTKPNERAHYLRKLGRMTMDMIEALDIKDDFWAQRQIVRGVDEERFQPTQKMLGHCLRTMRKSSKLRKEENYKEIY